MGLDASVAEVVDLKAKKQSRNRDSSSSDEEQENNKKVKKNTTIRAFNVHDRSKSP